MDFFINLINYIKEKICGPEAKPAKKVNHSSKRPIFNGRKTTKNDREIPMVRDISDQQIQANQQRQKYITVVKNPSYKVKSGDNPDIIASKFGLETRTLLAANGLTEESAKNLRVGQVLKIPSSKKLKNVRNLNDVAKAMGVSLDFIKRLKKIEDKAHLPENKFHNTPYIDDAGVKTIGIGHVVRKGDPQKLSNAQVCTLCAKDLLKAEENLCAILGGQKVYDRIPQSLKEAVLDITFNKGILDDASFKGLIYCLKQGKWEAAINKLTYNKSTKTKEEMSGLSKRRLFDIALATKMYGNKIPQSNINTAQRVYNRGVELLRLECKKKGLNFNNQIVGYNNDVKSYFGNRIKLKFITK